MGEGKLSPLFENEKELILIQTNNAHEIAAQLEKWAKAILDGAHDTAEMEISYNDSHEAVSRAIMTVKVTNEKRPEGLSIL